MLKSHDPAMDLGNIAVDAHPIGFVFKNLPDVLEWIELQGKESLEFQNFRDAIQCLGYKGGSGCKRQLHKQCSQWKVPITFKVLQEGTRKHILRSKKDLAQALTEQILKCASDRAHETSRVIAEVQRLGSHSSASSQGIDLNSDAASLE